MYYAKSIVDWFILRQMAVPFPWRKLPTCILIYLAVNNVISRLSQKWCSSGVISALFRRKIIDFTNFFGTFSVRRASLPYLNIIPFGSHQFPAWEPPGNGIFLLQSAGCTKKDLNKFQIKKHTCTTIVAPRASVPFLYFYFRMPFSILKSHAWLFGKVFHPFFSPKQRQLMFLIFPLFFIKHCNLDSCRDKWTYKTFLDFLYISVR